MTNRTRANLASDLFAKGEVTLPEAKMIDPEFREPLPTANGLYCDKDHDLWTLKDGQWSFFQGLEFVPDAPVQRYGPFVRVQSTFLIAGRAAVIAQG